MNTDYSTEEFNKNEISRQKRTAESLERRVAELEGIVRMLIEQHNGAVARIQVLETGEEP